MINPNFYPTPIDLIIKMLADIDLRYSRYKHILEPSAGKGDIVDYITNTLNHQRGKDIKVDCIEIEPNLQHILKGKGYRVVHDDFLTYSTYRRYDLIVMNPPFSEGDKHLLKAIDLMGHGGEIVCLLNAETIKNPYSNVRKDLQRRLQEYDADIEFIENAFKSAERKTDVEIALIKLNIPKAEKESVIIQGMKAEEVYNAEQQTNGIISNDYLEGIIQRYNFEVRAGIKLLEEFVAMQPLITKTFEEDSFPILEMEVGGQSVKNIDLAINEMISLIRRKYWITLFRSDMFKKLFTSDLFEQYMDKLEELSEYDFSLYNIRTLQQELTLLITKSVEDTIIALFDEFSHKYSYYDNSNNIHYYNGWKTNKAWYINDRVIIQLNAFSWYRSGAFYPTEYKLVQKLQDIEKVFNYLDGGRTDHKELRETLKEAEEKGQSRNIELKYFTVTFYKKGTCHIRFTDTELLKKFNLFGSQRKGWLPPSYGKKKYEDMSKEEQQVIDDFEGKNEYEKVMKDKDYYFYSVDTLPALEFTEGGIGE